jgi:APA family basic amino acid/polyamine antiporter
MARKLHGFERILDAPALFAVAYGELAASIYFALGIVAANALGLTPAVLLLTGALFLVVSLSYAEGTAALPEAGGATTLVRRAFNDVFGFVIGWALFLDYLIVIALSVIFLPHYLGGALHVEGLGNEPWDVVIGVCVVLVIATARLVRRTRLHSSSIVVAAIDLGAQLLLVLLGFAVLFSPDALPAGVDLGTAPEWGDLAFALPLAMLAYTGLETISNLAEETREPGRALPRSLFSAIGLVVVLTVLIALVALSALPVENGETALADEWLRAPILGIVSAFNGHLPAAVVDVLQLVIGLTGALVLFAAATTSMSGCTRLAYALAQYGQLPRAFGRLNRRTLVSPHAIVGTAAIAVGLVVLTGVIGEDVAFLASLYSFGVLLTFTAAQIAVIKLRATEPELERPFRVPFDVTIRGVSVPLPALVGAPLTFAVWIVALITHPGARYAGPAWLVIGGAVYLLTRLRSEVGLLEDIHPEKLPPPAQYHSLLVPMKLGDIGEEMVATAVALAKEHGAAVEALYVIKVPLELPLDAELVDREEQAAASLAEAALLGDEHGVEVRAEAVKARSIGHAIVDEAAKRGVDLIVLGSSPRWRRQSRFFSPTVDHVLRNAHCEVLVVAFPQGVLEAQPASGTGRG